MQEMRYQITYQFVLCSNDSVGAEWRQTVTYNDLYLLSGDTIVADKGESLVLGVRITERDSVPDVGTGYIQFEPGGGTESIEIEIVENRGRYAGNIAVWCLKCTATSVE